MYDLTLSPSCTTCGSSRTIRVKRKGLIQAFVWTRLGYFPWECTGCRNVFLIKNRGKVKRRTSTGEIHLPHMS